MYKKLLTLLLTLTVFQSAFAQAPAIAKVDEKEAEFKKEALLFLRETAAEVNNLRSVENRISFSAELAGLIWFQDEKEARALFQGVVNDLKQLITNYDSQLTQIDSMAGLEGSPDFILGGDDGDKSKLERKFRVAMGVRQQIASSIAEHDPQMAFDFYYDSLNAISNGIRRKQYEGQDKYFESRLLSEIAMRDAAKALELGKKAVAKGVT